MKKNYQMALLNFRSLIAAVVFGIMIFLTSCAKEDSVGTLSTKNVKSSNSNVLRAALNETGRKNLKIKLILEGYYNKDLKEMRNGVNGLGEFVGLLNTTIIKENSPEMFSDNPEEVDYVSVTLFKVNSSLKLEQVGAPHVGIVTTAGFLKLSFDAPDDEYYLKVNHRNTIETWTSERIPIRDNIDAEYDFTNSNEKAYGKNMINLGAEVPSDDDPAVWAFFSGDISDAAKAEVGLQDGIVESQDYSDMENAIITTPVGYVPEDITGDGVVESADYSLMENNLLLVRQTVAPPQIFSARMQNPSISRNTSVSSTIIEAHK